MLAITAAIGFGLNPLFARLAYMGDLSPEGALAWRFGLPALVMLPFCGASRHDPRTALAALALGAGIGVGMLAYFRAVAVLPIALPALVYFTYPVFTLLMGRVLFGEAITARGAAAALCVLIACGLILSPGWLTGDGTRALLMCFSAPLAYALLLHGFARWLTPLPVAARTGLAIAGAFLVLVPASVAAGAVPDVVPTSIAGWVGGLGLATVCSLLPQLLIVIATPAVGATAVAIIGALELLTSLAVGWLILGEPASPAALLGAGLVIAALWLATSRPRPPRPAAR